MLCHHCKCKKITLINQSNQLLSLLLLLLFISIKIRFIIIFVIIISSSSIIIITLICVAPIKEAKVALQMNKRKTGRELN